MAGGSSGSSGSAGVGGSAGGDAGGSSGSNEGGGKGGESGAGGAAGSAGAAGDGGVGGSGGSSSPQLFSPYGYFDLSFENIEVSMATGPAPKDPPSRDKANHKNKFRIDIPEPQKSMEWRALVTPRWGVPSLFDVKLSSDALVLSGITSVANDDESLSDTWQTFTIPLSGGMMKGVVQAVGQEDVFSADEAWSGKLSGTGSITPDHSPPEAKMPAVVRGFGPPDSLLPWDALPVTFAEPLSAEQALASVQVYEPQSDALLSVSWQPGNDITKSPSGVSTLLGYLQSWDAPLSAPLLRVADGFLDPAGNVGEGVEQPLFINHLQPYEGTSLSFNVETAKSVLTWGQTQMLGGVVPSFECETGYCLLLDAFSNGACGVERAGVAMRFGGEKTKLKGLKLRFRALFAVANSNDTAPPPYLNNLPVASIQLARAGKVPEVDDVLLSGLEDLGEKGGEFRYATPWTSVVKALPPGNGPVGIALRAGGRFADAPCGIGASGVVVKTKLYVETVSVE